MKTYRKRKFGKLTSRKRNRSKYSKQKKINIKNKVYKKKNYSKKFKYYGGGNINSTSISRINTTLANIVQGYEKLLISIPGTQDNIIALKKIAREYINDISGSVNKLVCILGSNVQCINVEYTDTTEANFVQKIHTLKLSIVELNKTINDDSNKSEDEIKNDILDKFDYINNVIHEANSLLLQIQRRYH